MRYSKNLCFLSCLLWVNSLFSQINMTAKVDSIFLMQGNKDVYQGMGSNLVFAEEYVQFQGKKHVIKHFRGSKEVFEIAIKCVDGKEFFINYERVYFTVGKKYYYGKLKNIEFNR